MAVNPVVVTCTKDQWTKIASAVKTGLVIIKNAEAVYFSTYRVAGDPAPAGQVELENESQKGDY